jgi:hypothetical protein
VTSGSTSDRGTFGSGGVLRTGDTDSIVSKTVRTAHAAC